MAILALAVLAAPALAAEPGAIELSVLDSSPVVDRATTIATPPEADAIEITYGPSSPEAETETLAVHKLTPPKPGKPYLTVWVPKRAGAVELAAGGQTIRVSVGGGDGGMSLALIALMIAAGLILFGGALWAVRAFSSRDD